MNTAKVNKVRPTRGRKEFWATEEHRNDAGMLLAETGRLVSITETGRAFSEVYSSLRSDYFDVFR